MTEISGKAAFVTGGGSGIGRALALALAREARAVVVADILAERAMAVAEEVRSAGCEALGLACDVSDRSSVRQAHARAGDAFGDILLLFANAGATSFDPIDDVTDEIMDWIVQVNLMGVSHCAQVFAPGMIAAGDGHIMATSSMAGLIPDLVGEHAHYAAAKLGVVGLMLGLRREIDELGVGTTVLCPGGVRTGMAGSGSYRPERFGGPFQRTRTAPSYHKVQLFRPPGEVAEMVLAGVRRNRAFVVTDESYRDVFAKQYVDEVLQAFDDAAQFDREQANTES
jgi:NAD(P)-dependent dehydrogenase (short-subunit alcohol dehydrogenase family)